MDKSNSPTSARVTAKTTVFAGGKRVLAGANPRRQSILPPTIKKQYNNFLDHSDDNTENRYKIGDLLGSGAFGQIYSAFDRSIGRKIAIKSALPGAQQDKERLNFFLHEARITASLQHPNIMPIYDLDADSDGRPYFTMRQIDGMSLGEAIDRAALGKVPPEIKTYASRVNIILKVLDAMAYVHSCGIVHQDIKPDNIMLGKFGEVIVSDWGTASFITEYPEGRLIGTPLFMPPEQSQHRPVNVTNDIYAVGATLYNLLTWQYPMDDQDSDRFWEKKFNGVYDDLPPAVEHDVPRALLDIARKAMNVEIGLRYPSADAMAQDLRHYLDGTSVSAHRDSLREVVFRNYRRHRRILPLLLAAGILIMVVSGLLMREKMREWSAWKPMAGSGFEPLDDSTLAKNWEERQGAYDMPLQDVEPGGADSAWHVRDGMVYGRAQSEIRDGASMFTVSNLVWKHNITGGIRVDFSVVPLDHPVNLNCFIAGESRENSYVFHIGGWNDPRRCVLTKGTGLTWLAEKYLPNPIVHFREYRIRMEYDNQHVRLYINNQLLIDYNDSDPLTGIYHQTFGFEADSNARSLYNVQVYQKPAAEKISPLAVPDVLMQTGNYSKAIEHYEDLLRHYPKAEYASLVNFRIASCIEKIGDKEEAFARYRDIVDHAPRTDPARLNAMVVCGERYLQEHDVAAWEKIVSEIASVFPGTDACKPLLNIYAAWLQQQQDIASVDSPGFLAQAENCLRKIAALNARLGFGSVPTDIDYSLFELSLLQSGYPDAGVRHLFWRESFCQRALNMMGEYAKVAAAAGRSGYLDVADALIFTGRFKEAIDEFPYYVRSYIAVGDYTNAWRYARTHNQQLEVLLSEGKFSEAMHIALNEHERLCILALTNRENEYVFPPSLTMPNKRIAYQYGFWQAVISAAADTPLPIAPDNMIDSAVYECTAAAGASLRALAAGDRIKAAAAAASAVNAFQHVRPSHFADKSFSPELCTLLCCMAQSILGDIAGAKTNLETLRQFCRMVPYRYNYLLPHVEYLLGDIDKNRFTARANCVMPHEKKAALLLADAWRADLNRDQQTARTAYSQFAALPPQVQTKNYPQLPLLRKFIKVRLARTE